MYLLHRFIIIVDVSKWNVPISKELLKNMMFAKMYILILNLDTSDMDIDTQILAILSY